MSAQIDLFAGRRARDRGAVKVLSNEQIWAEGLRNTLKDWFWLRPLGFEFTGEDMRVYALSVGMTEPHHPNAWSASIGGMVRSWRAGGQINYAGATQASLISSHARTVWKYRKVAN